VIAPLAVSATEIGSIATAIGVLIAAFALLLQRGQARTSFEDSLVRQYRELIKPELVLQVLLKQPAQDTPADDAKRLQSLYLYFDLCNEQIYLRFVGRVSKTAWIQWRDGIEWNLAKPEIGEAWLTVKDVTADFQELRRVEADGFPDPRRWEPIWRRPLVRFGVVGPCQL
jgi:hypothetical protein